MLVGLVARALVLLCVVLVLLCIVRPLVLFLLVFSVSLFLVGFVAVVLPILRLGLVLLFPGRFFLLFWLVFLLLSFLLFFPRADVYWAWAPGSVPRTLVLVFACGAVVYPRCVCCACFYCPLFLYLPFPGLPLLLFGFVAVVLPPLRLGLVLLFRCRFFLLFWVVFVFLLGFLFPAL